MRPNFLFGAVILVLLSSICFASPRVEIKDGWFYVDGEKFFVKGMCYFEIHVVDGKVIYNPPEMVERDFKLIKEAGFNTVKSYLTPVNLKIAEKYGLMAANLGSHSCFNGEYRDPKALSVYETQISSYIGFAKEFDNILYYTLDNEPSIFPIYYGNQEKDMENVWRAWVKRAKSVQPGARVTLQMMPPTAWADTSMADIASLNLYPWNPAGNSIGYSAYLDWYLRARAMGRPLVVSEYGWTENVNEFGPRMIGLLDEQLKTGVAGSYLFIWREAVAEKTSDAFWWGVIPFNGKADDWKLEPRPVYQDYKEYFEAVAVEPKKDGVYAKKLPFEIYGTDKTGSMTASVAGKTISLTKKGKYWWVGEIETGPGLKGPQKVTIEAKDKSGARLALKEIQVFITAEKNIHTVKIARDKKILKSGDTYKSKITVTNSYGLGVPDIPLKIGVNQSSEDPWISDEYSGVTGAKGEYVFTLKNIGEGYLNVMAGIDPSVKGIESLADVDMARVELSPSENTDAKYPLLNRMNYAGLWKTQQDAGSRISLLKAVYGDGSKAMEVSYDLGSGKWVAMDEIIQRNLSKYRGIRFTIKNYGMKDRIEVKLFDADHSTYLTYLEPKGTDTGWTQVEIPFSDLKYGWGGDETLDLSNVTISFAISRADDTPKGPGKLAIGKLEAMK